MVLIRKYKNSDYSGLIELLKEAELFDQIWESEVNIKGMVADSPDSIIVADEGGEIVGNVFIISYGPKLYYLFRLAVKKDFRKKGIGTMLINKALELARGKNAEEVGMYVDSGNSNLLRFYKKRGFKKSDKSYHYLWKDIKK